jgi:hypothetical protein
MRALVRLLPLTLATAALAAAPAAGEDVTDRWEKTFNLGARPTVNIVTEDGDVVVGTWDRRAVMVRITTVGWKIGPHDVRVHDEQDGDRVSVEALTPSWGVHVQARSCGWTSGCPSDRTSSSERRWGHRGPGRARTRGSPPGRFDRRHPPRTTKLDRRQPGSRDGYLRAKLDARTGDGNVVVDGKFSG